MSWIITGSEKVTQDPYLYTNTVLLLKGDGANGSTTILDSSKVAGSPKTVTAFGNAQISTAQSKFGGASIAFDGSGDYLEPTDISSQLILSGDFTIECWVYFNSLSGTQVIMQSAWDGSSGSLALWHHASYPSKISLWADSYSAGSPIIEGTTTLATGNWYFVAATRLGNDWQLFVNGVSQGTRNSNAAVTRNIRRIGNYSDASGGSPVYGLNGYIDDLRITKGVARDVSTVPTAPFPDI